MATWDKIMTDRTAVEVKIADLEDNMDVRRLGERWMTAQPSGFGNIFEPIGDSQQIPTDKLPESPEISGNPLTKRDEDRMAK